MSKQTGLIMFTGKMGGISFYKRLGQHVARRAGGPSRKRILTDPAFARTRENMSEFAGLAQASASFSAIFASVKNLRDSEMRGRATKVLRAVMKLDDAVRGQRNVLLTKHPSHLIGFELNANNQFKESLRARFTVTHSADRKTATFTITDLRSNSMIAAPHEATHFQLLQLTGVLADTVFDVKSGAYQASDGALNEITNVTFSDFISVNNTDSQVINLSSVLPEDVNEKVSVVQAIGILFFTRKGTAYYPSELGKAMEIVDVY